MTSARIRTELLTLALASPDTASSHSAQPTQLTRPRMIGKLVHATIDVVLVSAVLAGVKRHTGFECVVVCLRIAPPRHS